VAKKKKTDDIAPTTSEAVADVAAPKKRGRPKGSSNNKAPTGKKRGRPKGSVKTSGHETGNGISLKSIIREIVREELLAAFK